jgi:hypothetical protein
MIRDFVVFNFDFNGRCVVGVISSFATTVPTSINA